VRTWKFRLLDIVYAARRIRYWTEPLSREAFFRDLKTLDAVLRELEVLGEAARHLPERVTRNFPDIPWRQIIGLRSIVAHAYFRLNPDALWKTVREDIPALERRLLPEVRRMFPQIDLERAPLEGLYPPAEP
jgi:uncharacterized protein with HEPN domain